MGNQSFQFKQFVVNQQNAAMKIGVDAVLLGACANPGVSKRILDIGTGTGLLCFMMAQKSEARITGIEIDQTAYKQALENSNRSKWNKRIEIQNISLQDFMHSSTEKFDFVLCNPPYFNSSLVSPSIKRSLARHDHSLKLNDLFLGVSHLTQNHGIFTLIYPFQRKAEVLQEGFEHGFYPSKIIQVKGTNKKLPNRVIIEFCRAKQTCIEMEIVIRNSSTNDYTHQYKELTKEYYLNF